MTITSTLEPPFAAQRSWTSAVRMAFIVLVVAAIAVLSFAVGRVTVHTSSSPAKITPSAPAPAAPASATSASDGFSCRGRPC
jgi:hypothetical protein